MKIIISGLVLAAINMIPGSATTYYPEPPMFRVVEAEISAYTSSVEETDDTPFVTASGGETRHGVIACPSKLEFGTKIEIEGKIYFCEDRMHERYRDKEVYDVWVVSKETAYEWGRKKLEIKIYD